MSTPGSELGRVEEAERIHGMESWVIVRKKGLGLGLGLGLGC